MEVLKKPNPRNSRLQALMPTAGSSYSTVIIVKNKASGFRTGQAFIDLIYLTIVNRTATVSRAAELKFGFNDFNSLRLFDCLVTP